jgi:hypothetical protein
MRVICGTLSPIFSSSSARLKTVSTVSKSNTFAWIEHQHPAGALGDIFHAVGNEQHRGAAAR